MIVDHIWRPLAPTTPDVLEMAAEDRPCAYMNCRQPRAEHERALVLHRAARS